MTNAAAQEASTARASTPKGKGSGAENGPPSPLLRGATGVHLAWMMPSRSRTHTASTLLDGQAGVDALKLNQALKAGAPPAGGGVGQLKAGQPNVGLSPESPLAGKEGTSQATEHALSQGAPLTGGPSGVPLAHRPPQGAPGTAPTGGAAGVGARLVQRPRSGPLTARRQLFGRDTSTAGGTQGVPAGSQENDGAEALAGGKDGNVDASALPSDATNAEGVTENSPLHMRPILGKQRFMNGDLGETALHDSPGGGDGEKEQGSGVQAAAEEGADGVGSRSGSAGDVQDGKGGAAPGKDAGSSGGNGNGSSNGRRGGFLSGELGRHEGGALVMAKRFLSGELGKAGPHAQQLQSQPQSHSGSSHPRLPAARRRSPMQCRGGPRVDLTCSPQNLESPTRWVLGWATCWAAQGPGSPAQGSAAAPSSAASSPRACSSQGTPPASLPPAHRRLEGDLAENPPGA